MKYGRTEHTKQLDGRWERRGKSNISFYFPTYPSHSVGPSTLNNRVKILVTNGQTVSLGLIPSGRSPHPPPPSLIILFRRVAGEDTMEGGGDQDKRPLHVAEQSKHKHIRIVLCAVTLTTNYTILYRSAFEYCCQPFPGHSGRTISPQREFKLNHF